jgi:hypothetical protein
MSESVVVASLLGHRQMAFSVPCLQSLLRNCADAVRLRLHDDGTLSCDDLRILDRELLGPEIVSRAEADRRAEGALAPYPRCADLRRSNPLALKLIDVGIWGTSGIHYCDSDIFFVRPFQGLFQASSTDSFAMADPQNAYSIRPSHLLLHRWLRLVARLNSGILVLPRSSWRIEDIERILGLSNLRPAVWVEQTCWAALAQSAGCRLLDPRQFVIPGTVGPLAGDAIAFHFVSSVRHRLVECLSDSIGRNDGEAVHVRSVKADPLTPWELLATRALRRLRRIVSA